MMGLLGWNERVVVFLGAFYGSFFGRKIRTGMLIPGLQLEPGSVFDIGLNF